MYYYRVIIVVSPDGVVLTNKLFYSYNETSVIQAAEDEFLSNCRMHGLSSDDPQDAQDALDDGYYAAGPGHTSVSLFTPDYTVIE